METVDVECPYCYSKGTAPKEIIGRNVKCPKCGMTFVFYESKDIVVNSNIEEIPQTTPQNKNCPFCAEEILADTVFCKHCKQSLLNPVSPPPSYPISNEIFGQQFQYTGTWQGLFGLMFGQGFLCLITLGIYYPWAYCNIRKWIMEHTYAENRQLTFIGNGGELFGIMLIEVLLTIVTIGIWSFLGIPIHKMLEFDTINIRYM